MRSSSERMTPRGHVPDRVVALLDLAQRVLGAAQVDGRVELLGLGEQLLLQLLVGQLLAGALLVRLAAGGEEDVLGGAELLPQVVVAVPAGARHGLPAVHQRRASRRWSGPSRWRSTSLCASAMSSCLAARASPRWASREAKCAPRRRPKASRAAANRVHSASSVLRSMPRIVFHSSTIAFSRSPAAFQDGGLGGDLLRLGGQRLLAGDLRRPRGGLLGARLGRGGVGRVDHRPGPGGEPVEVADRGGGRDRVGQRLGLGLDLARVAGVRLQPRLEQRHLGGQVVVAAAVVGQPGGRLAGLPGADGALALGGADVDGAVVVDPAPAGGVADRGGRDLGRRGGSRDRGWCRGRGGMGRGTGGRRHRGRRSRGRRGAASGGGAPERRGVGQRRPRARPRARSARAPAPRRRAGSAAGAACRPAAAPTRGGGAASSSGAPACLRRAAGRRSGVAGDGAAGVPASGVTASAPVAAESRPRLRNRRRGLLRPVAGVLRARHVRQCPTSHRRHLLP